MTPHPKNDTFCLFQRPPSTEAAPSTTHAQVFTPSSNIPTQTKSVPFHLTNQGPCPPHWTSSPPSSFSFVGITSTWNVVVVGDDVRLPEDEGSSAKGLKGLPAASKRTLFQDIFGASAIVDVSLKKPPPPRTHGSWKGKEVEKVFDTAAYFMPPLETVFDTVMDGFFSPRPAHELEDEEEYEEEHDEMDVDRDETVLVESGVDRVVGWDEMDTMVELFKHHGVLRECFCN